MSDVRISALPLTGGALDAAVAASSAGEAWVLSPDDDALRRHIAQAGRRPIVLCASRVEPRLLAGLPALVQLLALRPAAVTGWALPIATAPGGAGADLSVSDSRIDERAWNAAAVLLASADGNPSRPSLKPSSPAGGARAVDRLQALFSELSTKGPTERAALWAGLWQIHDFLDESHRCAQSIEGEGRPPNGDYWHAIMHRREPDYGNSKYWFHQVGGQHPVLAELPAELEELGSAVPAAWRARLASNGRWDPFAFVDCCAAAAAGDGALREIAEELQYREMLRLLRQTTRDAWQSAD